MSQTLPRPAPLQVLGGPAPEEAVEAVLTPEALEFLSTLVQTFRPRWRRLLDARGERRESWKAGSLPHFLPETAAVRRAAWQVAPMPDDLTRRQVEITGPVDRKMIINALNSGADVFMADFEDATSPTWANVLDGQRNLMDAVRGTIEVVDTGRGRHYRLGPDPATLMVRPRGLHLTEAHVEVDGEPVPASLFDFGLFLFHNVRELLERGSGPYFYLPKLESHTEARFWNDVFVYSQAALGIPQGTIRATVLIETLPAAFEMDEILYELREHSAGLNCGRWDYIFSFIKTRRWDPEAVLPDRSQVTMEQPFMRAYTRLAVQTCHRRGAHAIGGMAAQIPIKTDPDANRAALAKVRADKLREVWNGHDGTWVAHPALVPIARDVFQKNMQGPHQIHRTCEETIREADLLQVPRGSRTETGLRWNVRVGIQYLAAWLGGQGCVPLYHLMEDAATAEISRAQVWQWLRHRARLEDGGVVTPERVRGVIQEELSDLRRANAGAGPDLDEAAELFASLCLADELEEFLTLPAYSRLLEREGR